MGPSIIATRPTSGPAVPRIRGSCTLCASEHGVCQRALCGPPSTVIDRLAARPLTDDRPGVRRQLEDLGRQVNVDAGRRRLAAPKAQPARRAHSASVSDAPQSEVPKSPSVYSPAARASLFAASSWLLTSGLSLLAGGRLEDHGRFDVNLGTVRIGDITLTVCHLNEMAHAPRWITRGPNDRSQHDEPDRGSSSDICSSSSAS
ncbi:MAG: hypothetical protein JWM85_2491 [Acidimicrobiaceae bacterium]|nr:hypothetical protein [Acidimicrobiaceae bacterium]